MFEEILSVSLAVMFYRPNCCPLNSIYHHHLLWYLWLGLNFYDATRAVIGLIVVVAVCIVTISAGWRNQLRKNYSIEQETRESMRASATNSVSRQTPQGDECLS